MSRLPSLVLVDDAADLRLLLRTRIDRSGRMTVVGEGGDGREAVELVERHRPDLLLLDVSMPDTDGLGALPALRAASPRTSIVMYSGFDEDGLAARARELGAAAYLRKSGTLGTLVDDLLAVLAGREPAQHPVDAGAGEPLLEEHVARFREVFDDAAIGMATLTLAGRVVRANRSLARLTGRAEADLVGTDYDELVGARPSRSMAEALMQVVAAGEDAARLEHDLADRPGVRVDTTLAPVRDGRRTPLYLFLQAQDVSRQYAADQALRRSEQRFRLLVDAVRDYAIFMLDPDGRIASWNLGAERFKGYAADEIVGRHFRVFYPPELQEARHPEHELEVALRDGRYEEEGWRIRKDGSRFWAQVTLTAVHDEEGQHVGFAKVTRDVTERLLAAQQAARAAEALEAANHRLQQAADEQSQMIAVTAHELRGPVGILGMSAETLQRHGGELDESEREAILGGMVTSAAQLNRLLSDLLTTARLQAQSLDLRPVVIDLRRHLAVLADGLRKAHPQAVVLLDGDEDATILADPGRLTQAMDNLLTNALRHGRSPVRVDVRPRGALVDVVVSDAGGGVAPELQPRLFERFATGSRGGTGLGLHIVRELARAQGGDAAYDADAQAFVLSLPAFGPTREAR